MREQMQQTQTHSDSANVYTVSRKRDEKRDRKLEEREELKTATSSLMGPPSSMAKSKSSYPSLESSNYTHYIDKCFECFSKELVTKTREGTIVCQNCGLV